MYLFLVLPQVAPFSFDEDMMSGAPAQVTCFVAKGDLPMDITWLVEGQQVVAHRQGITVTKLGQRSSILGIDVLSAAHAGNYTCLARNAGGSDNWTAELVVHGTHGFCHQLLHLLPYSHLQ